MKTKDYIVSVNDGRFNLPLKGLTLDLYESGVYLSDGTIIGTHVINGDNKLAKGEPTSQRGEYKFSKIPIGGIYTVVLSGLGITTQIPEKFIDIDFGVPSNVTGNDIPYGENTNISIYEAISNVDATSQIPRIVVLETDVAVIENELSDVSADTSSNSSNIITLFNYNTNKSVEVVYRTGGNKSFATIQSALNEAFATGGNVLVHEKPTAYNEILIGKNNVNLHLEGNAKIETSLAGHCFNASGISCIISGEGSIRNIHTSTANRYEAVHIENLSNVIIKNDSLYSIGKDDSAVLGSTVYATESNVEIYSRLIQNDNNVGVYFHNSSSGRMRLSKGIVCENAPAVYIETDLLVEIENTNLTSLNTSANFQGVLVYNSSSGTLSLKDVRIDNLGDQSTDYGINIIGSYDYFYMSGVEIVTNIAESIYSESDVTINIRKQSWGLVDRNSNIILKGLWAYGYE